LVKKNLVPEEQDLEILEVRRVDWRFLLPSPALGRVLYVGTGQSELRRALGRFSGAVVALGDADPAGGSVRGWKAFDLIVVEGGNSDVIRKSLPLLRPGGAVYWEFTRPPLSFIRRHPRRYMDSLAPFGLTEIDVYWPRPDFDTCIELVPIARDFALRFVFDRTHETLKGRLKLAIGRFLAHSGLLAFAIRGFSVVAIKPNALD
jgi:hypothetical protein